VHESPEHLEASGFVEFLRSAPRQFASATE
jgi:hypothetical protein